MLALNLAETSALADELGRLEAELKPFKQKLARVEALRKGIRALFRDADATTEHRITGNAYAVLIGACGNESLIDTPALVERIGTEKFAQIASASLKAIELHCGADVLAAVVLAQQTGPRPLTVSELPKPKPVAAAKKPAKRIDVVAESAPPVTKRRKAA